MRPFIATITVSFALLLSACGSSSSPDGNVVAGSGGARGICCPIESSCGCVPNGGWAPSLEECPRGCDLGSDAMRFTDEYGCDYVAGGMSEGCDTSPWRDGGVDSGVDAGVEPAPDAAEDAATNSSVVVPAPSGPQYCCVNPDTCFGDVADPAAGNPCETGELRVNVAACLVNDAGRCSCFCGE